MVGSETGLGLLPGPGAKPKLDAEFDPEAIEQVARAPVILHPDVTAPPLGHLVD